MKNFKLLAIRPLVECHSNFLKNLTPGSIYKFYQTYNYFDRDKELITDENCSYSENGKILNNEVKHIDNNMATEEKFFDIENKGGKVVTMNFAAVVGKNGSGKSALLELLYAMSYVVALRKDIIPDHTELRKKWLNKWRTDHDRLFKKMQEIEFFYDEFRAEIFYEMGSSIYSMRWDGRHLTHHFLGDENREPESFQNGIYTFEEEIEEREKFLLNKLLFYTISINYSLYGLNTESGNEWLQNLFHKNDGYQTPVVINPYREKGNINVNTELHLAQTRLLLNIFKTGSEELKLVNDKAVDLVAFELHYNKFDTFGSISLDNVIDAFKRDYKISDEEFFIKVYNAFYGEDWLHTFDLTEVKNSDFFLKYLYRKIFKIAMNYEEYRAYIEFPNQGKPIPKINGFFDHLAELKEDRSHITLKLCQILNIIRYNFFTEDEQHNWQIGEVDADKSNKRKKEPPQYFVLPFTELIQRIQKIYTGKKDYNLEEFIPAACVIPRLAIKTGLNNSNFEVMSSGEQHFVHSMQSIFYHLKNIDSVFSTSKDKIKYRYVNLSLDEIELYFHPEFQRDYIHELRQGIKNLNLQHIEGINVLLSTHSPFILSDIPHSNILRMDGGKAVSFDSNERTFGANLHDLLKNDFFLKNSFMGEQARKTIQSLIEFLRDTAFEKKHAGKWDEESSLACIELVGEPILRNSLRALHFEKYPNEDEIDREIERLQQLKRKNDRD